MLVRCDDCGEMYKRFNSGGYQDEEKHNCNINAFIDEC